MSHVSRFMAVSLSKAVPTGLRNQKSTGPWFRDKHTRFSCFGAISFCPYGLDTPKPVSKRFAEEEARGSMFFDADEEDQISSQFQKNISN